MKLAHKQKIQTGFTLLELMVSVAIFIVISGAIFGLLGSSQKQFRTESEVLGAFQEARLGLDQIVRDASDSGYPPVNHFSTLPPLRSSYVISPVAWMPGYLTPAFCTIGTAGGGTCATPNDFDVIFEGAVDNTGVKWIRYQLVGTTLFRGVVNKSAVLDPVAATNVAGVMLPYVTNVMNNPGAALIGQFQAAYPGMFPGGVAQPIFQYACDIPNVGTVLCQNAGANNSPANVRDVEIMLIVMTPERDFQTGRLRLVQLNGRGHRINPNQ